MTILGRNNMVTIHGKVQSTDIKELEISGFIDNPINGISKSHTLSVDNTGSFSKVISLAKSYEARLTAGIGTAKSINLSIYLSPGDEIEISINDNEIIFKGNGAEKLKFLYELDKNQLLAHDQYSALHSNQITTSDYIELIDNFKQRRSDFLKNYKGYSSLPVSFIKYFNEKTSIEYLDLIVNLFKHAFYTNKSIVAYLDKYQNAIQISNYANDEFVNDYSYVSNIRNFIFYVKNRQICYNNETIDFFDAVKIALTDSLEGTTRDYALAEYICSDLKDNKYDTLLINTFNDVAENKFAKETIEKALIDYKFRNTLIGKPLHREFALTNLADTANVQLTFGEMINKYKGNIIYLEFWSLGCGPCRKAMPTSRMIEKQLSGYPVKFVYLTYDKYHKSLWKHIFEASLTKHGHYRLTEGSDSRINKFMNSTSMPWYMLFDKQGKLISYKAEEPYSIKKTLIKLSKE